MVDLGVEGAQREDEGIVDAVKGMFAPKVTGYRFLSQCGPSELSNWLKNNIVGVIVVGWVMALNVRAWLYQFEIWRALRTGLVDPNALLSKMVTWVVNFTLWSGLILLGVMLLWVWRRGGREVLYPCSIFRVDGTSTGDVLVVKSRVSHSVAYLDDVIANLERALKKPGAQSERSQTEQPEQKEQKEHKERKEGEA